MNKYLKEYKKEKAKRLAELENMRLANAETVQNIKEEKIKLKQDKRDKAEARLTHDTSERLKAEQLSKQNAEERVKADDDKRRLEMDQYLKEYQIEKARRIAQDKKDMEDAVRKKRYDEEEIKRLERLATAEKLKLKSIEDTAKRILDNEERI